jgi:hypothetical protein
MIGLSLPAWNLWLQYRRQIKKPLRAASIELAQKRMAALGERQMEAVEHSIANGYTGLFAPKSAKKIVSKLDADKAEMEALTQRARNIGFRDPLQGEDVISYRMLVARAEEKDYWNRRKGPTPISQLLKGAM